MPKKVLLSICTLLIIIAQVTQAQAATITGTIYTYDLDKAQGAVITINTTPRQVIIAADGTYQAEVPRGEYQLSVSINNEIQEEETLTINDEGTYNHDFIIFPKLVEIETPILPENLIEEEKEETNKYGWLITLGIILILAGAIGLTIRKKPKKKTPKEEDIEEQLLRYITKEGTTTQKELRKKIPYSEAKISLMLSSLQAQGKIEKIKKGRGNIIRKKRT